MPLNTCQKFTDNSFKEDIPPDDALSDKDDETAEAIEQAQYIKASSFACYVVDIITPSKNVSSDTSNLTISYQ